MAKNWNTEVEKHKKETEEDPEDANAWYNMGVAIVQSIGSKLQTGNIDSECNEKVQKAEAALKKAIKVAPNHGRAHILLGQMFRYLKRYDEAIEYAEYGMGLPEDTKDWFAAAETVASCYMLKNDMPNSIKYLEIIKKHYPDDALTVFKRACCYWEVGDLDQAEAEFLHLKKVDPTNPNADGCLAQIRQRRASDETTKKGTKKADKTGDKGQDKSTKAQALGQKLTKDIQGIMASNMSPEKKTAEVTRLQKEFNDKLNEIMKE